MKKTDYVNTIVPPRDPFTGRTDATLPTPFLGWGNPDSHASKVLEIGGLCGLIDSLLCSECATSDPIVVYDCPSDRCAIVLDLANGIWTQWESQVRARKLRPELNRGANHRPRSCFEAMVGGAEVWYSDAPTLCGCKSGKLYMRTVELGACGICGASTPEEAEATIAKRRADATERKQKSRSEAAKKGAAI